MSELRLAVMREDIPSSSPISCGIASIDDRIKDAYSKTICKQGLAYNIYVDGYLIGNCMIKLVVLRDEANDYYVTDHEYAALEISYIAIDRRVQGNGIGTRVLARLISDAEKLSKILPIRFLVLDALDDKVQWYLDAGFTTYPKREDLRYADTVPMRIDLIDTTLAEKYVGSLN